MTAAGLFDVMLPTGFLKKIDKATLLAVAGLVAAGLLCLFAVSSADGIRGKGMFFFIIN